MPFEGKPSHPVRRRGTLGSHFSRITTLSQEMNVESCERTLLNLVQNSCLCIFLPKVKVNSFHWEHKNIKYYELSKQVDFNKEIKNIWDPVN